MMPRYQQCPHVTKILLQHLHMPAARHNLSGKMQAHHFHGMGACARPPRAASPWARRRGLDFSRRSHQMRLTCQISHKSCLQLTLSMLHGSQMYADILRATNTMHSHTRCQDWTGNTWCWSPSALNSQCLAYVRLSPPRHRWNQNLSQQ